MPVSTRQGHLIVEITELKKALHDARKRDVKLRYITEITAENVYFCKELLATIVDELRRLDGIKSNFYVSETEHIAPAASHEKGKPSSQIIHSNIKEVVEKQQYIFDTLWKKSISAEDKIKEIEQGIEPEYFRVIWRTLILDEAQKVFELMERDLTNKIINEAALTIHPKFLPCK
jgi:two-component system, OmpR family, sensor histidine kinase VicK